MGDPGILPFIFRDDKGRPPFPRLTDAPANRGQDVVHGPIKHLMSRIEPQTVHMEFVYPVARVGREEFAHRPAARSVEIYRFAPIGGVSLGEIVR